MDQNCQTRRPWLTPEEQVEQLASKGVSFNLRSKADAEEYLRVHNSFFRVRSYRANFPKYAEGPRVGQYIGLDFGMLADLAVIDMRLRGVFMGLTLDVEHYAKMRLLNELECAREDGYEIVRSFINDPHHVRAGNNVVVAEIKQGRTSPYTAGLIGHHPNFDFAVWEFIELITFGRFIHFYRYCAEKIGSKKMIDEFYLLQSVKSLRNACAHNSCILNDMKGGNSTHKPRYAVTKALSAIGIGKDARDTKLSNERMQHMATTLYLHHAMVPRTMLESRGEELRALVKRMHKHIEWYEGNSVIVTSFVFFEAMVLGWYGIGQNSQMPSGRFLVE